MEAPGTDLNHSMKTFKTLTLLVLGFLIFGSAGFFGYQIFIKPGQLEKRERAAKAAAPASTPAPEQGAADLTRLEALLASGSTAQAKEGLKAWVERNAGSPLLDKGRRDLGAANMALLFQPAQTPDGAAPGIIYTVVKGDSLARIAAKHQSNAELIQKANNLPNINLQIGEQLLIPALKISVELDRSSKTLTLLNNGTYLKEYTLLSAPHAPSNPPAIASKVLDKVATAGTKRVAFGDKAYPQSERAILLVQSPAIVALAQGANGNATPPGAIASSPSPSASCPSPAGNPPGIAQPQAGQPVLPMPSGYVLSEEDLREIFPLVSRNTPVLVH